MKTIIAVFLALAGFVPLANAQARSGGESWRPLANPAVAKGRGEFSVSNLTRFSAVVWRVRDERNGKAKKVKDLGRFSAGETRWVEPPKANERFAAFAAIPNARGGLSFDEVPIRPTRTGWNFIEPDFRQGGK